LIWLMKTHERRHRIDVELQTELGRANAPGDRIHMLQSQRGKFVGHCLVHLGVVAGPRTVTKQTLLYHRSQLTGGLYFIHSSLLIVPASVSLCADHSRHFGLSLCFTLWRPVCSTMGRPWPRPGVVEDLRVVLLG